METKKATAKIKEVVRTKDHTNNFGTTIYHSLLMDNGDKIQIGKKKLQQAGWELSYEITDNGQEFNTAKTIKPEEVAPTQQTAPSNNFHPKNDTQMLIVAQMAYKGAVELMAGMPLDLEQLDSLAKHIFNNVIKLGGSNE